MADIKLDRLSILKGADKYILEKGGDSNWTIESNDFVLTCDELRAQMGVTRNDIIKPENYIIQYGYVQTASVTENVNIYNITKQTNYNGNATFTSSGTSGVCMLQLQYILDGLGITTVSLRSDYNKTNFGGINYNDGTNTYANNLSVITSLIVNTGNIVLNTMCDKIQMTDSGDVICVTSSEMPVNVNFNIKARVYARR